MWKRAAWVEGRNEEEGVVPCTWIDEEKQSLYWPQGVNAENALSSRQHPDPKLWRKFQLVKVKVSSAASMTTVARGLDLAMTTSFATLTIPRNFTIKAMTAWTDFSNSLQDSRDQHERHSSHSSQLQQHYIHDLHTRYDDLDRLDRGEQHANQG
ncbi:hypothetical protein GWK47_006035 [Chionoecetes opilio]|uniref:Uncharacterized protein n=1 Tax=Chionoecetes opilio TaxID=41210 RepID=A0A8J4Y6K3_CHIOP|nr:hypothetical protein GWK47_006035 [Chionoecetes opilio]